MNNQLSKRSKIVWFVIATIIILSSIFVVNYFGSKNARLSADVKCGRPQCMAQGSRSQGWYDNCGLITFDNNCNTCGGVTYGYTKDENTYTTPVETDDPTKANTNNSSYVNTTTSDDLVGWWYAECDSGIKKIKYEPGYINSYDAAKGIFELTFEQSSSDQDNQTVRLIWPKNNFFTLDYYLKGSNSFANTGPAVGENIAGIGNYNNPNPTGINGQLISPIDLDINNYYTEITYPKDETREFSIAIIFGESNTVTVPKYSDDPTPTTNPTTSPETEQTCSGECQRLGFEEGGECSDILVGGFGSCPNGGLALFDYSNCPGEGDEEYEFNCCCSGDSENKPETPTLTTLANSDTAVTVTINTVEGADYYHIASSFGSALPPNPLLSATVVDNGSETVSHTFTGLECETQYNFRVVSYNQYEGYVFHSDLSDPVYVTTRACGTGDPEIVNRQPDNISIDQTGSDSVTLSWGAVEGARGYNIYDCDGNYVVSTNQTSYTFTHLLAGVEYCFYVEAHDGAGHRSLASDQVRITPTGNKGTIVQTNSLASTGSNIWIYLLISMVFMLGVGYFVFKKDLNIK